MTSRSPPSSDVDPSDSNQMLNAVLQALQQQNVALVQQNTVALQNLEVARVSAENARVASEIIQKQFIEVLTSGRTTQGAFSLCYSCLRVEPREFSSTQLNCVPILVSRKQTQGLEILDVNRNQSRVDKAQKNKSFGEKQGKKPYQRSQPLVPTSVTCHRGGGVHYKRDCPKLGVKIEEKECFV
ncbi:hypothetical protein LR48_Vigan09g093700 [Vigna angularis]|uniref:Uncharacterized protein n=1 Tax=Phaseolus angularis TaxID=3914 RepID=A0A0L9VB94_PHAAN|nr:hypothetical protein LR48_Vigan09g093700 [Vigna angularis]